MEERTLNLAQCKEYMKNIIELELSCYEQEGLLRKIISKKKAVDLKIEEIKKRWMNVNHYGIVDAIADVFESWRVIFVGLVIGLVFGFFARWIFAMIRSGFLYEIFVSPNAPIWVQLLVGAGIGSIGPFLVLFIYHYFDNKSLEKWLLQERIKYKDELADLESKSDYLQEDISKIQFSLEESQKIRGQYYDLGFIYPKYRSLVPVATMYEYLDSGRCFSLIGPGGAYNLYESELRMNTIIGKLDDVISRLDDIAEGQRLLAQEIRQSNARIDSLTRTLDNIEGNTAVTAYYSEITAQNTTYQLLYQGLIEMTR